MNYNNMGIQEKKEILFSIPQYVDSKNVRFKINADFVKFYSQQECYREIMVSYLPMLPLLENTVPFEDADYILYMHMYARCQDMSDWVVEQLKDIAKKRKEGAEIIVLGKACNAEKLLNGSITNITFLGDHFTEKLGKKFGLDIREQYFVYDDVKDYLAIWPVDGCLQKCNFCRRSFMNIKFESLSLDTIEQNLNFIKEYMPETMRVISLRAENLTEYGIDIYRKPMLHKLIDLIDSYNEVEIIELSIGLAIGEITPEILDSICRSSKITGLSMNLETGSNRLLKLIGKKHTCEQAEYVFGKIREAHPNIEITSGIMIGLPTEKLEDIIQLANLIGKTQPDEIQCNYYISSPRHPLAQLPQISNSLREYHLKFLLNLLKNTLNRDLTITHYTIFKSTKSNRIKLQLKKSNEANAKKGLLPKHYSDTRKYTGYTK